MLMYIWQLPQNLVGLVIYLITGRKKTDEEGVYTWNLLSGISLGNYIFINERYVGTTVMLHELGHRKQSKMLGPLYLIIIGLPSLLWAFFHSSFLGSKVSYYSFYTEKWADKLSNITR